MPVVEAKAENGASLRISARPETAVNQLLSQN
jgi:hypothetical protein